MNAMRTACRFNTLDEIDEWFQEFICVPDNKFPGKKRFKRIRKNWLLEKPQTLR